MNVAPMVLPVRPKKKPKLLPSYLVDNVEMLSSLQIAHDDASAGFNDMVGFLRTIAQRYDLDDSAVDTLTEFSR